MQPRRPRQGEDHSIRIHAAMQAQSGNACTSRCEGGLALVPATIRLAPLSKDIREYAPTPTSVLADPSGDPRSARKSRTLYFLLRNPPRQFTFGTHDIRLRSASIFEPQHSCD